MGQIKCIDALETNIISTTLLPVVVLDEEVCETLVELEVGLDGRDRLGHFVDLKRRVGRKKLSG